MFQKRGKQKMLQPDLPPDVPFYASRDEVQNEGVSRGWCGRDSRQGCGERGVVKRWFLLASS